MISKEIIKHTQSSFKLKAWNHLPIFTESVSKDKLFVFDTFSHNYDQQENHVVLKILISRQPKRGCNRQ